MITEQDLREAIAECQGERDPNSHTAIKLAAYLTIQKALYGDRDQPVAASRSERPAYSYAPPDPVRIGDYGESDFLRAVSGRDPGAVWPVMDEMMDTIKMVNERLYNSIMKKIAAR